jgi:Domain of unknown function (DUF222)/HNH endonuclease
VQIAVIEDVDIERRLDLGGWLVRHRWEMDRGESAWLEALAEFDREQRWESDGQLSCPEWLMWRAGMARATAYEKLRIAHELRRRPEVAAAFGEGKLSYSAVRAITRLDNPDSEVDVALVELAMAGSISDVERMVRHYQLHADQHRRPPDPECRRGLRIRRFGDGTGTLEVTLTELELDEVAAVLQAFLDLRGDGPTPTPDANDPQPVDDAVDELVEESPTEDWKPSETDGVPAGVSATDAIATGAERSWPARRADALMEMTRCALAHAGAGHAMGADRYLVHVVRHGPEITGLDGTPLGDGQGARILCDHSEVEHLVGAAGEPLALGRKTRHWGAAQRRAILVRDGGTCRFPGCERRIVDVHHIQPWSAGGATDLTNGLLVCSGHHTLLHSGYKAIGDANHAVRFFRPDETLLAVTFPRHQPRGRRADRRSCASETGTRK